jgi:hypothetical protein
LTSGKLAIVLNGRNKYLSFILEGQVFTEIQAGPKVQDLSFQFMPEKGRRDSITGMNRYWPELLAVTNES